jgi:diguanylate cyclase (GGDEF)-like protein
MLVLVIGIALQACLSVVSLLNLRQALLEARQAEVKHLLETAYSTVVFYHNQAVQGKITEAQAQQAAKDAVRAMHYDGNNYFFIWTLDGVGVAHGSHPEWEGHNLLLPPDAQRLPVVSYMVARLVEVCKSHKQEGVTTYRIPKYGGRVPLDKIAYTKLFVPWGWSVGTGAYVDDIDAVFRAQAFSILRVFAALIGLAAIITFLLSRNLTQALQRLTVRVASVAKGELDGAVPEVNRNDEVGVMARALLVLRDNSREVAELRLDQLTGLPTRKLLMDRLRQAMKSSACSGNFAGLMMIDLDKFKILNDTRGHDVGDMLLREVAHRLRSCVRETDTVARLGGDEFVVVITDIGHKEGEAAVELELLGEKVLTGLAQPFHLANYAHLTTASIGLTLFRGYSVSGEELLKQADLAMYRAKDTGRNAWRFFDPRMEETVRDRAALEADLRDAIAAGQFLLHYQPQIGLDGHIIGAEALVRWDRRDLGIVAPGLFIPLAEETGLILPLGRWVLETACRQLACWARHPELCDLKLSVNVSTSQFQRPDFVSQLLAIIAETGAKASRLKLELTESLCVDNVDEVVEKMYALRAKGIGFSLDDFGTGYSSLAYLKRMPLDQLKIDRSFVRDVLIDPNDAAIAKTIVALASTLGLGVIAEGVETAEQREFLARSGCHAFQGFLFSRPLPVASFEQFAEKQALIDQLGSAHA